MKLIIPGLFLLFSSALHAQTSAVAPADDEIHPVYVMLVPAGADTGLEIRSHMRIDITHIPEGRFMGFRYKDKAFLMACNDDKNADILVSKISALYKDAKVQKLGYMRSYINEGFNDIIKNQGYSDPTFPIYYETEDTWLNGRSYQIEKRKWIAEHPDSDWAKANTPQK
jgi:hypothetical protein